MATCFRYPNAERCINCGWNMRKGRKDKTRLSIFEYRLGELGAPERELLTSWLGSIEELNERPVCRECVSLLNELADDPRPVARQLAHKETCVACGDSVSQRTMSQNMRRRKRPLELVPPDEQAVFKDYVQFHTGEEKYVCQLCHEVARRVVEKAKRELEQHQVKIDVNPDASLKMESEDMEHVEDDTIDLRSGVVASTPPITNPSTSSTFKLNDELILDGFSKLADNMNGNCAVCDNASVKRLNLPTRQHLILRQKLYTSTSARVCETHNKAANWPDNNSSSSDFNGEEISDVIFLLKGIRPIDFGDVENLNPYIVKQWLGVSLEEYQAILEQNPMLQRVPGRFALAVYLASKHTGESATVLASVSQRPREMVVKAIQLASKHMRKSQGALHEFEP